MIYIKWFLDFCICRPYYFDKNYEYYDVDVEKEKQNPKRYLKSICETLVLTLNSSPVPYTNIQKLTEDFW